MFDDFNIVTHRRRIHDLIERGTQVEKTFTDDDVYHGGVFVKDTHFKQMYSIDRIILGDKFIRITCNKGTDQIRNLTDLLIGPFNL